MEARKMDVRGLSLNVLDMIEFGRCVCNNLFTKGCTYIKGDSVSRKGPVRVSLSKLFTYRGVRYLLYGPLRELPIPLMVSIPLTH